MKFYIGTTNPYKVRELASILRPLEIELFVTEPLDPKETSKTFEGNAEIKAKVYAKHVGKELIKKLRKQRRMSEKEAEKILLAEQIFTISEDSGLIIPALGGIPGPWSARFTDFSKIDIKNGKLSGHKKSSLSREKIDLKNNQKIIELMKGIEQPKRSAKFIVSLKVADINGNILFSSNGEAHGWIAEELRGEQGFGYDPIFISDTSFGKTWAEIDSMRKNLISHRRKALQDFTMWLATLLKKQER
jgi:XTP/dITP diphosphohydrolase